MKELRFYNAQMNDMITIRDLMSHRTGIPRHDFSWYFFPTFSKDSLITRIQYHEPFTSVRNKYYYNNFMFLLQGVIGERITGNLWEDNIRSMFFEKANVYVYKSVCVCVFEQRCVFVKNECACICEECVCV